MHYIWNLKCLWNSSWGVRYAVTYKVRNIGVKMLTEAGGNGWGGAERYCVSGTVRDLGCQRQVQDRAVALGEH